VEQDALGRGRRRRGELETLRQLRREAPGVPIVAVSGGAYAGRPGLLGRARQLGAARTLDKPFGGADALAAVEAVLRDASAA
jgi:DNA-binding response OmpR family regulator